MVLTQMPEYLHQFRPIGLCNVIFKVMTVIVRRLKLMMPKLISEVQRSFVPGRHVTNNIIVTQGDNSLNAQYERDEREEGSDGH